MRCKACYYFTASAWWQQGEHRSAAEECSGPGNLVIKTREHHLPVHKQLSHELLQGGPVALDQGGHLGPDVQGRVQAALTQTALAGDSPGGSPGQLLGQVQSTLQQLQPQVHHCRACVRTSLSFPVPPQASFCPLQVTYRWDEV